MKMVMVVVPKEEADGVIGELVAAGHTATLVESRGGVLRQRSQLLFVVVEDQDVAHVLHIISRFCRSEVSVTEADAEGLKPAPQVGGAVVFVWGLEDSRKY